MLNLLIKLKCHGRLKAFRSISNTKGQCNELLVVVPLILVTRLCKKSTCQKLRSNQGPLGCEASTLPQTLAQCQRNTSEVLT